MINRVFLSLTAVLALALASAPVSAAPQEPSSSARTSTARQITLGVSMLPDSADSYAAFTASTGRAPALWALWADWADGTSQFPADMVTTLKKNGTVPLIFWQPVGGNSPSDHPEAPPLQEACGTDYSKIISGTWDTYIHQWAHAAMGKGRILIRFAHEMDGAWFPWGNTNCGNTPDKFKTMWKHVVGIFRADRATNVKFVWSPYQARAKQKAFYPGNGWVDYIGFTVFNWAAYHRAAWTSLVTGVKQATKGLTYAGTKPWIVAETGSAEEPGNSRASWLTTGYKGVYSQLPKVKAIVYFNVDMGVLANQPNWALNSADLAAYGSLLKSKKFQGKIS